MQRLQRTEEQADKVIEYAITCPLGTLCAFWVGTGGRGGRLWLRTAKLADRTPAYTVMECLDGKRLRAHYEDVVWVKTGKYWPKFVMEIFAQQKADFAEYKQRQAEARQQIAESLRLHTAAAIPAPAAAAEV